MSDRNPVDVLGCSLSSRLENPGAWARQAVKSVARCGAPKAQGLTAWRSPKRSIIGRDEFGRTLSVKSSPGFYTRANVSAARAQSRRAGPRRSARPLWSPRRTRPHRPETTRCSLKGRQFTDPSRHRVHAYPPIRTARRNLEFQQTRSGRRKVMPHSAHGLRKSHNVD